MSYKETTYVARPVDANGFAEYTAEENAVWGTLIHRQMPLMQDRACDEFINGIKLLDMPYDRVPQCPEISAKLKKISGWELEPVAALIPFNQFFYLLANKKFPAATFIRRQEELDYLQEPDIFHEVFGHCPLLTNQSYADFTEKYGQLGLQADPKDRAMLARLYWFTIEFGLIKSHKGLRTYGGGILSSYSETQYCLESDIPERKAFNVMDVLRTPYRIDIMQPIYFVINGFSDLFDLTQLDLIDYIHQARKLGEYPPAY